jgi:capsid protein
MRFGSLKGAPTLAPVMASSGWAGNGWSFTHSQDLYPSPADSSKRGRRPNLDRPTWAMIPQSRHRAMLSDARYLYAGSGAIAGACDKVADYAVGWAWQPTYKGTDDNFRAIAERVINGWLESCDVRGGPWNWRTGLRAACHAIDRDGDCFAVFTVDPDTNGPRIQWVEADRIGTPTGSSGIGSNAIVPDLPETRGYAGRQILCGVIMDEQMKPLGFNVLPYDGYTTSQDWFIIPASSVAWVMDPKWFSQSRGIPSLVRGIIDWYDLHETVGAEAIAAKVNSSLALIESNETGRQELSRQALGAGALPVPGRQGIQVQAVEQGLIRYIKSTGKLEAHRSDRPSNGWLALMEHLTRSAFAGMGLPYEFAWDSSKIGGAGVRAMVGQVTRAIENRQHALAKPARAILLYAVASYMRRGDIPFTADWWNWDFALPSPFSVDMGRDSQNRREDLAVGIRSLSDILAEDSISVRDHLQQRANDYLLAKAISEEQGVPIQWLVNPSASFGNTADQAIEEAAPTVGPATPAPAE